MNVTTVSSDDRMHRAVAHAPTKRVATHGVPRPLTDSSTWEIGSGQARSRPLDHVMRANWSVIARDAFRKARIATTVTTSRKPVPKASPITSVSGVSEPRNDWRSSAPKTAERNGTSSKVIPRAAAVTTALPTCDADPPVSSTPPSR